MQILNAIEIKNGKKAKGPKVNSFSQPIQFLPEGEKDMEWYINNADWIEWQGIKQIKLKSKRMLKNYQLANGIIDRRDYLPTVENDMRPILEQLSSGGTSDPAIMELEFYPIIPSLINVLTGEFSKRNTRIEYRAVDEYTANEILKNKTADIESVLLEYAEQQLLQQMLQMGLDPNSPEAQKQRDPEVLKKLPEIEEFYNKTYLTTVEKWAMKQHQIDVHRFRMEELEEIAFFDSLATDSAFFHFRMFEDDYEVEVLNPVLTFSHKSPNVRYTSNGNYAGFFDVLTLADILDRYGYLMTLDQQESLESIHPTRNAKFMIPGVPNDGSLWAENESYDENRRHGVDFRRFLSFKDSEYTQEDVINCILEEGTPMLRYMNSELFRVCTMYWKTQCKIGFLTEIDDDGGVVREVVDEHFITLTKPIYNKTFEKKETAENLVFGQHIEWFWINKVVGVVKIGNNSTVFNRNPDKNTFSPIYLGIDRTEPGPLKFQFKGDNSLYGAALPIEGTNFSNRNARSNGFVDLLTPSQIGFNMVNNQIKDILIDELGPVVAIDQNAVPKRSGGEDWGYHNFSKVFVTMKDHQILPLDPSLSNTENPTNFQHYQVLNMEQTNRLMSRVSLAEYFRKQAMDVIGFSPQRLGQQIGQVNNATGVEQAVTGSFNQTEKYFTQFSDRLMPRVHAKRTDLAQYYHANKSSSRLQTSLSPDERVNFEVNKTDLLLADLNVFCMTSANIRAILDKMKKIFEANGNATGASIFDLGRLEQAETIGTMNEVMKSIEKKAEEKFKAEQAAQKEQLQMELDAKAKEEQLARDHEALEKEKDRRNRLLEAEIKASGYGAQQDINQNQQSDFQDTLDRIHATEEYQQTMSFNKSKENTRTALEERKLDLKEKEITAKGIQGQMQIQVARENKNKYDKKK